MLLWRVRPPIVADLSVEISGRALIFLRVLRGFGLVLAGVMSVAAVLFSITVATFPGEWRAFPLSYVAEIEPKTVKKRVFGVVDPWRGTVTGNWPSNTLRLQGFDIFEALKVDDPKKFDWKDHTFDLHSRQLESAVFDGANLGKVDLKGADLEGASLRQAKLQGAALDRAQLQGPFLAEAQLQGVSLYKAQLQGASLEFAQLQGAFLAEAQLQGVWLIKAQLQGASLEGAQLQGGELGQGASLDGAQPQARCSAARRW